MRTQSVKIMSRLGIALIVLVGWSGIAHAQWTKVNSAPKASNCLLLTDGTLMCQQGDESNPWNRLTPDNMGHYDTGTWSALTNMPTGYAPLFYASAVLADGRVVIIGGEYNNGCTSPRPCDVTTGVIFDPTANGGMGSWTSLTPPSGWANIGDANSVILADGTFILGHPFSTAIARFNPSTLNFTLLNATGKADNNSEEGWTILPDGTFLTVDAATQGGTGSEIYTPSPTNSWASAGSTIASLPNNGGMGIVPEVGPAVLRPDGTVIAFGSTSHTAVYDTKTTPGTWTAGPDYPLVPPVGGTQMLAADAPASLLINGNVLIATSDFFKSPTHMFEFDGTNLNVVTDPPNNGVASFQNRMLLLPTGQVLVTNGGNDAELYTPSGTFQDAWRPAITSAPTSLGLGVTYTISGTLFNGFSQGAAYGDDSQFATNYPLVRITNNGTGHVFYARTHDHSSMGVEAVGSAKVVTTNFDVPATMETGASKLVVVTNGIPSTDFDITVAPATTLAFTAASATTSDFRDPATVQARLTSGGNPVPNKTVTFVLGSGGGAPTCSATTDVTGTATCSLTPNQPAGTYTLTATFAGDTSFAASSTSTAFLVTHEESALAFTGASATTADFNDAATVQAQLTTDGLPLPGEMVTFVLGSGGGAPTCSATTDLAGNATCSLTPNQPAGTYPLTATFGGDAFYVPSSASTTFTVTKEETTLKFTASSPTVIANNNPATFSATLKEDGTTPISGRTVTITLGSGGGAQSCTGTTDASGTATCTIVVNQPLGPNSVTANFAGDAFYLPSSDSESVIVFAFLAQGSMVIGNLNAGSGNAVTFWGAQWAKLNALSGGPAPNAFKGFAGTAPHSCGGSWIADPGNSGGPPNSVPSYMGVIASSTITQSGSTIAGDVPIIVVVKTNPGYGPAPGHAGTGTVVAAFCP
jgi:hypothetical protein